MSRGAKIGLLCAGYALAVVAGGVAGRVYDARVSALPYDTSGGMYAGGQLLFILAAFLVVALAPTALGLWFLRRSRTLWRAVAFGALGFAAVGLIAVLMPLVTRGLPRHPALMVVELLGLAQLLGMPLWTAAFALFAFLAPAPPERRLLAAAIGLELVIGLCAAVHWLVPSSPL